MYANGNIYVQNVITIYPNLQTVRCLYVTQFFDIYFFGKVLHVSGHELTRIEKTKWRPSGFQNVLISFSVLW